MVGHPPHSLIKRLQAELPHDAPFDLDDLRRLDVPRQAASHYAKTGWLIRVGHGVYALPGATLTPHGMVKLLQRRLDGLHIGGRTALGMHGVRHTLAIRERMVLWGDVRHALPEWFTSRQPARYVSARLFEWPDGELDERTVTTPPDVSEGLRVSAPERAALEMLYEVGTNEDLEEARRIFEGLRNVRTQVVGRLLSCCTSVKAVRLFLTWARESELLDVDALLDRHQPRVGSSRRWVQRLKDGTLLTLKPHG